MLCLLCDLKVPWCEMLALGFLGVQFCGGFVTVMLLRIGTIYGGSLCC